MMTACSKVGGSKSESNSREKEEESVSINEKTNPITKSSYSSIAAMNLPAKDMSVFEKKQLDESTGLTQTKNLDESSDHQSLPDANNNNGPQQPKFAAQTQLDGVSESATSHSPVLAEKPLVCSVPQPQDNRRNTSGRLFNTSSVQKNHTQQVNNVGYNRSTGGGHYYSSANSIVNVNRYNSTGENNRSKMRRSHNQVQPNQQNSNIQQHPTEVVKSDHTSYQYNNPQISSTNTGYVNNNKNKQTGYNHSVTGLGRGASTRMTSNDRHGANSSSSRGYMTGKSQQMNTSNTPPLSGATVSLTSSSMPLMASLPNSSSNNLVPNPIPVAATVTPKSHLVASSLNSNHVPFQNKVSHSSHSHTTAPNQTYVHAPTSTVMNSVAGVPVAGGGHAPQNTATLQFNPILRPPPPSSSQAPGVPAHSMMFIPNPAAIHSVNHGMLRGVSPAHHQIDTAQILAAAAYGPRHPHLGHAHHPTQKQYAVCNTNPQPMFYLNPHHQTNAMGAAEFATAYPYNMMTDQPPPPAMSAAQFQPYYAYNQYPQYGDPTSAPSLVTGGTSLSNIPPNLSVVVSSSSGQGVTSSLNPQPQNPSSSTGAGVMGNGQQQTDYYQQQQASSNSYPVQPSGSVVQQPASAYNVSSVQQTSTSLVAAPVSSSSTSISSSGGESTMKIDTTFTLDKRDKSSVSISSAKSIEVEFADAPPLKTSSSMTSNTAGNTSSSSVSSSKDGKIPLQRAALNVVPTATGAQVPVHSGGSSIPGVGMTAAIPSNAAARPRQRKVLTITNPDTNEEVDISSIRKATEQQKLKMYKSKAVVTTAAATANTKTVGGKEESSSKERVVGEKTASTTSKTTTTVESEVVTSATDNKGIEGEASIIDVDTVKVATANAPPSQMSEKDRLRKEEELRNEAIKREFAMSVMELANSGSTNKKLVLKEKSANENADLRKEADDDPKLAQEATSEEKQPLMKEEGLPVEEKVLVVEKEEKNKNVKKVSPEIDHPKSSEKPSATVPLLTQEEEEVQNRQGAKTEVMTSPTVLVSESSEKVSDFIAPPPKEVVKSEDEVPSIEKEKIEHSENDEEVTTTEKSEKSTAEVSKVELSQEKKFFYMAGQWSPENPSGLKEYTSAFLVQFEHIFTDYPSKSVLCLRDTDTRILDQIITKDKKKDYSSSSGGGSMASFRNVLSVGQGGISGKSGNPDSGHRFSSSVIGTQKDWMNSDGGGGGSNRANFNIRSQSSRLGGNKYAVSGVGGVGGQPPPIIIKGLSMQKEVQLSTAGKDAWRPNHAESGEDDEEEISATSSKSGNPDSVDGGSGQGAASDSTKTDSTEKSGISTSQEAVSVITNEKQQDVSAKERKKRELILVKNARSIVNKLTPQKFEPLCKQLMELNFTSEASLDSVVAVVFEKALDETHFSQAYAKLCYAMVKCERLLTDMKEPTENQPGNQQKTAGITVGNQFRKLLVTKCMATFHSDYKSHINETKKKLAMLEADTEEKVKAVDEHFERLAYKRYMGNIRFIGELIMADLLTPNIVFTGIVPHLMAQLGNTGTGSGSAQSAGSAAAATGCHLAANEGLEAICKLLTVVGSTLERENSKTKATLAPSSSNVKDSKTRGDKSSSGSSWPLNTLDKLFLELEQCVSTREGISKYSPRTRFMIQDVINLRKQSWKPRRVVAGPKTIDEIHQQVEKEEKTRDLLGVKIRDHGDYRNQSMHMGGQGRQMNASSRFNNSSASLQPQGSNTSGGHHGHVGGSGHGHHQSGGGQGKDEWTPVLSRDSHSQHSRSSHHHHSHHQRQAEKIDVQRINTFTAKQNFEEMRLGPSSMGASSNRSGIGGSSAQSQQQPRNMWNRGSTGGPSSSSGSSMIQKSLGQNQQSSGGQTYDKRGSIGGGSGGHFLSNDGNRSAASNRGVGSSNYTFSTVPYTSSKSGSLSKDKSLASSNTSASSSIFGSGSNLRSNNNMMDSTTTTNDINDTSKNLSSKAAANRFSCLFDLDDSQTTSDNIVQSSGESLKGVGKSTSIQGISRQQQGTTNRSGTSGGGTGSNNNSYNKRSTGIVNKSSNPSSRESSVTRGSGSKGGNGRIPSSSNSRFSSNAPIRNVTGGGLSSSSKPLGGSNIQGFNGSSKLGRLAREFEQTIVELDSQSEQTQIELCREAELNIVSSSNSSSGGGRSVEHPVRDAVSALSDHLANSDFKELTSVLTCLRLVDVNSTSSLSQESQVRPFIERCLSEHVDSSAMKRTSLGNTIRQLIQQCYVLRCQFSAGFLSYLRLVVASHFDVPKIWEYSAQILAPLLEGDKPVFDLFPFMAYVSNHLLEGDKSDEDFEFLEACKFCRAVTSQVLMSDSSAILFRRKWTTSSLSWLTDILPRERVDGARFADTTDRLGKAVLAVLEDLNKLLPSANVTKAESGPEVSEAESEKNSTVSKTGTLSVSSRPGENPSSGIHSATKCNGNVVTSRTKEDLVDVSKGRGVASPSNLSKPSGSSVLPGKQQNCSGQQSALIQFGGKELAERVEGHLRNLLGKFKSEKDNDSVIREITKNEGKWNVKDKYFVRLLTNAILDESFSNGDLDMDVIAKRFTLLRRFTDGNADKIIQILYSMQVFNVVKDYPTEMITNFFLFMADNEIVSREVFISWKQCSDSNELHGKGVSVAALQRFFDIVESESSETQTTEQNGSDPVIPSTASTTRKATCP